MSRSPILHNTPLLLVQQHTLPYTPVSVTPLQTTHLSLSSQHRVYLPDVSHVMSVGMVRYGECAIINETSIESALSSNNSSPILCEIDMQARILFRYANASENAPVSRLYFDEVPIIYFHTVAVWQEYVLYVTKTHEVFVMQIRDEALRNMQNDTKHASQKYFQKNAVPLENEEIAAIVSGAPSTSWFSFGGAFRGIQKATEETPRSNRVKSVKYVNSTLYILREHSVEAWQLDSESLMPTRIWIYKLEHLLKRQYTSKKTYVLDFVVQNEQTQITLLLASTPQKYASDQTPLIQYHLCYLHMNQGLLPSIDTFYTLKKFSRDYNQLSHERLTNVKLFAFQDTYYLYFEQEDAVEVAVQPFVSNMMKRITLKDVVGAAMLGPDLHVYSSTNGVYVVTAHHAKEQYLRMQHGDIRASQFKLVPITKPQAKRQTHNFARYQILQLFRLFLQGKPVDKGTLSVTSEDIFEACRLIVDAPFASTYQWTQLDSNADDDLMADAEDTTASGATILIREHIQRKCEDFDRFMEFLGMDLWRQFTEEERDAILELGEKLYATRGIRMSQTPPGTSNGSRASGELDSFLSQPAVQRFLFECFKEAALATCETARQKALTTERATIELFFTFSSNIQEFFVQLNKTAARNVQQRSLLPRERSSLNFYVGSIYQHAVQQIKEFRTVHFLRYNNHDNSADKNAPAQRYFTPWTCGREIREPLGDQVQRMKQQLEMNADDAKNPVLLDILYDLADFRVDCTLDKKVRERGEMMSDDFETYRNQTFDMLIQFGLVSQAQLFAEKYLYFEALVQLCVETNNTDQLVAYMHRFRDAGFLPTLFDYLIQHRMITRLFDTPRDFWPQLDVALREYPELRWMLAAHQEHYVDAAAYVGDAVQRATLPVSRMVGLSLQKLNQLAALASGKEVLDIASTSKQIDVLEQQEELRALGARVRESATPLELIDDALQSLIPFELLKDFQRTDPTRLEEETRRANEILRIALRLYALTQEEDKGSEIFASMLHHAFLASYPLQTLVETVARDEPIDEQEVTQIFTQSTLAGFIETARLFGVSVNKSIAQQKTLQRVKEKASEKVLRSALDYLL